MNRELSVAVRRYLKPFKKDDPWPERAMDFVMLIPTCLMDWAKGKSARRKILALLWFAATFIPCFVVVVPILPLAMATMIWGEMK